MKAYVLDAVWAPKPEYQPKEREISDKRAVRGDMVYRDLRAGLKDVPDPAPGPGDVLIRVGACGVCGSDMHAGSAADDGYTNYAGHLKLPVIMGHELSGEVIEAGVNVRKFKPGDLIAVEQMRPCGLCDACKTGFFNSCRNIEEVGLSIDGGFCEYAVVPETYCIDINDIVERLGDKIAAFEAGALAEPTGVAYNGLFVRGKGITPGSNVSVFGAGPIGLASISLARVAGAAKIFAIDVNEERLKLAKLCGADYSVNPAALDGKNDTVSSIVLDQTGGVGCKTVVEAAGAPDSTYPEIVKLMSINANVSAIGRSPRLAPIDLERFIVKGCSLSGSIGTAGNDIIPSVLKLMGSGKLDMRGIITGRYDLSRVQEGIGDAKRGNHGKVMISQFYG
ncbi:MAG: alcohol dehydrogenase catalytic domain-containing protein [Synergistaceae bacterium]|nr:alcohol dehydrogenase catalytic domain-containing protein [Synergistaceae bacterium]